MQQCGGHQAGRVIQLTADIDTGCPPIQCLAQDSLHSHPFYLHLATTTPHSPVDRHPAEFDPLVAYLDVMKRKVVLGSAPQVQPSRESVQQRFEQVRELAW